MTERWHVLPNADIKPHAQAEACKCEPRIETQPNGNKIVVHNAWDGREFKEIEDGHKASGH